MLIPDATEKLFEFRFPARADRLCLVRVLVKRALEESGCSESVAEKMVIALNEACMNIIQHAYGEDNDGDAVFECYRDDSDIYFRLLDYAAPIDLDKVQPRDLDDIRPGGLGVHFMREIMDAVDMGHLPDAAGNYLDMRKKINATE